MVKLSSLSLVVANVAALSALMAASAGSSAPADAEEAVVRELFVYSHYSLPYVAGENQTYTIASEFCASQGSHLLTLSDRSEYEDLFVGTGSLFPPSSFLYNGSSAIWLGMVNDTGSSDGGLVSWDDGLQHPDFLQPGSAVYRWMQFNYTDYTCANGERKRCCASLWFFGQRNTKPTVLYYDCGVNIGVNMNRTDRQLYWQVVCKAPKTEPSPYAPSSPPYSLPAPYPPTYPLLPLPSPHPPSLPSYPVPTPYPPTLPLATVPSSQPPAFPPSPEPSPPTFPLCDPAPGPKGPCGGYGWTHMACYYSNKTVFAVNRSKSECLGLFESSSEGKGCKGNIFSWGHGQYGCGTFLAYKFEEQDCREKYFDFESQCPRMIKNKLNFPETIAPTEYKTVYKCIGRSDPPAPPCVKLQPQPLPIDGH